jgi:hypothetical protein
MTAFFSILERCFIGRFLLEVLEQDCNYDMLRKADTISQNVGSLIGNNVPTDVSMVDNSIGLYLTSASGEKYITELLLEGKYKFVS